MALPVNLNNYYYCSVLPSTPNPNFNSIQFPPNPSLKFSSCTFNNQTLNCRRGLSVVNRLENDSDQTTSNEDKENNIGVKAALSMLRFYKREISPLMPNSCRYVPTCSEYSMIAYRKYGVVKGSVLTAWRLCRCNPLGNNCGSFREGIGWTKAEHVLRTYTVGLDLIPQDGLVRQLHWMNERFHSGDAKGKG